MGSAGMESLVGGRLSLVGGMREIWNGGGRKEGWPASDLSLLVHCGLVLGEESVPVCPWGSSGDGGQGLWVKLSKKGHFPKNLCGLSGRQSGPEF